MHRHQRFMQAINSQDVHSWDSPIGVNYKRFIDCGFDVSETENTKFVETEVKHGDQVLFSAPQRTQVISVSNALFNMEFRYVYLDMSAKTRSEDVVLMNGGITVQHYFQVDNKEPLDEWLAQMIWDHKIDLREGGSSIPTRKLDPVTGELTMKYTHDGVKTEVVTSRDGEMKILRDGKSIEMHNNGEVSVSLQNISGVGIQNILDLRSYSITRNDDRTFHLFDFSNGGIGELTFSKTGKLEVFSVTGTKQAITNENHITLEMVKDWSSSPSSNEPN